MDVVQGSSNLKPRARREGEHRQSCTICCSEDVFIQAHLPCNHSICHICAIKCFIWKMPCPVCRKAVTSLSLVHPNHDSGPRWFAPQEVLNVFPILQNVHCFDEFIAAEVVALLQYRCWFPECNQHCGRHSVDRENGEVFSTMSDLTAHLQHRHLVLTCSACLLSDTKKSLIHEHELFESVSSLERHYNDLQFKHTFCEMCCLLLTSAEEMRDHCEKIHERCIYCTDPSSTNIFYKDAQALACHSSRAHNVCGHPHCSEHGKQFTPSEFTLHNRIVHQGCTFDQHMASINPNMTLDECMDMLAVISKPVTHSIVNCNSDKMQIQMRDKYPPHNDRQRTALVLKREHVQRDNCSYPDISRMPAPVRRAPDMYRRPDSSSTAALQKRIHDLEQENRALREALEVKQTDPMQYELQALWERCKDIEKNEHTIEQRIQNSQVWWSSLETHMQGIPEKLDALTQKVVALQATANVVEKLITGIKNLFADV